MVAVAFFAFSLSALGVSTATQLTSGSMCLDWTSKDYSEVGPGHHEAYFMPCSNGAHQQWSNTAWGGLTTDGKLCLDYTSNTYSGDLHRVYVSACDSQASHQKWSVSNGKVESGGFCMDWTDDTHDSGKHATYLHQCSDSDHQTISWSGGPGLVEVFPHGWAGSKCYRIPTILRTSSGALLAFAEARLDGCGDSGNHNLVARRSTDDGMTWGELIVVTKGENRPKHTLSNPNPVEVTMANGEKVILLLFDTQNNPSMSNHGDTMQTWSHDDGQTWVDSSVIVGLEQEGFTGCMPGPSLGIQESSGTIYFTCHTHYHAFLAWSTDFGKSWQHSPTVNGIDECSIAALPSGDIAMNCRSDCGGRSALKWSAAGELLSNTCIENLPDPGCQGSMIFWQEALYLSNEASTSGRNHLTVRRSVDEGLTWDDGIVVEYGNSGYSQLVGFPSSNTLGVLYENDSGIAFKTIETGDERAVMV